MSAPRRHRCFANGLLTRSLICATSLVMAVAQAQNPPPTAKEEEEPEDDSTGGLLSGNDLFPDNSVLKHVILPTYDEKLHLTNTLSAEEMTIVTKTNIEARNLKIDFYGDDRSPRGSISLKKSFFDATKKLLTTQEPVSFVSDEMNVDGSSMTFDTESNRGFLFGPVTAVSKKATHETTQNAPAGQKGTEGKAAAATDTGKESAAPAQAQAEGASPAPILVKPKVDPLAGLTTEEKIAAMTLSADRLQQIKAEAASRAPQIEAARAAADNVLAESRDRSEGARIDMNSFFTAAALTMLAVDAAEPPTDPVPRPVMEAPKEGTQKTTITSDGGMFIDNTQGLTVFLKNVKVVNPEFTLTAQKEVQAFMTVDPASGKSEAEQREEWNKKVAEKQAARAAKAEAEKNGTAPPDAKEGELPAPPEEAVKPIKPELTPEQAQKQQEKLEEARKKKQAAGGATGDVKRLIASGTVLIDYQPKPEEGEAKKDPVKAAAHLVIYDLEKEEILLQGGSPWVMIGTNLAAVNGNDSYIQVTLKDGRPIYAVTKGGSIKAELELDDMKEKDKPKEGDKAKTGENKPAAGNNNKPAAGNNGPKPPAHTGAKPNNR
ncbi:hypothetical protein [Haloferula sp. BvORR071]|uniref:hypothetical protein n=1 Tax=Haloferula sp. BvORR071 TaxID=1396141 RepID=UPI00055247E3|nr:hypothetical protein [Haloferula sp. BvORR071]